MSSFALFIIWVSILFFSAGFAQEMNSIQDFDPIDDQSQDPGGFQNLLSSEGAEVSDLPESTFIDTSVSDFEDSSVFTDTDLSDFHDAAFSSSILDASCANDDGIKPGKLRARGLSCVNQPDTAETLDLSKPSSSWKGDAVGVMTSDSYWCIDLQFALYHTVAVCDQLHPGALQISSRHYAVYPSSLSKFYISSPFVTLLLEK